ncbi:flagellar biosynthesis anti-sigma factor FlgM [Ectothiorhodospira mobilis]|uniref:Negative regulator of flagellin synthesis n=1 Tax=Ectothiorhodospira mobilis TaxID=195064 RepID=A0A1I4QN59_ECTMO|nr:flagellar biosynthesis anti-sigma factor FlgM [Ectothiorhodospira mobilis]MCG5535726.1 flagellar biosynthesis anti-sigma factor FlgM [Ectothiorhodospira mobilis]SFM41469.1 anti-sigma-28 factor, FlgM family [Ectothiorhodospira mobilis]
MSIEIKNLNQPQARGAGDARNTPEAPRGGRGNAGGTAPTGPGDKVTLTETARRLSDLEQSATAQPEVNSERVEALRQAIAEGRYEVDARAVAEKIMNAERMI